MSEGVAENGVLQRIARWIVEDAAAGWQLDGETAENAFSSQEEARGVFEAYLGESELDSETLSRCSALLFPPPELQHRLEPVLLRQRFSRADIERIGVLLEKANFTIRCRFSERVWQWRPHPALIPVYLDRFHFCWTIDRELLGCIVRAAGKKRWKAVMVQFRNREFPKTTLQAHLLTQLFEAADLRLLNPEQWRRLIDFLAESIPEAPSFSHVGELIEERMRFWVRLYDQTVTSDLRREQFAMERWMMAKVPMGALVKEEILEKIGLCERLLDLYNRRMPA